MGLRREEVYTVPQKAAPGSSALAKGLPWKERGPPATAKKGQCDLSEEPLYIGFYRGLGSILFEKESSCSYSVKITGLTE